MIDAGQYIQGNASGSVAPFILAPLVGLVLGVLLILTLYADAGFPHS